MSDNLTYAEDQARKATELPAFPINLQDIRRQTEDILSEFGRYGFFNEYTNHSFDHVHAMLEMYDWLIPERAKSAMTSADWLLLTLGTYLHDLGLIISRDEFAKRDKSGFSSFCADVLFKGEGAEDYEARLQLLPAETRDKFLYEEFVRFHHGARVKAWIEGSATPKLGAAEAAGSAISDLLSGLAPAVRKDLAIVCESHNLDDIDDLQKYRVAHPYGVGRDSSANLQYIALLLRTADLLQITNKRTPAVLFKLINPTDPISQIEWQKQGAVIDVRSKIGLDKEQLPDATVPRDTVEIFANFNNEEGFFGLTSYLRYARHQLLASYNSFQKSSKRLDRPYSFPWKYIDDENITTDGFLKDKFGFELDQAKILTLLTGHTLYNDSTVVMRELIQNAIDAVRLEALEAQVASSDAGHVWVKWDSKGRELTVSDNGTGMTQEIIINHLLKVGSSRYQDPKFIEEHPTFSPISRFGIGVLSAFMVADNVEITTCSEDEPEARRMSLRSVHGQYLIRLLSKQDSPDSSLILPHGTTFKLKLRPSAKIGDVAAIVRRWVMFPGCNVSVQIDGNEVVPVGYDTPKQALEDYLESFEGKSLVGTREWKVEEREADGVVVAFALSLDYFYKDWAFVSLARRNEERERPSVGTFVEGIGVEFSTPGFRGAGILAVANTTGSNAPKTNVARSALEDTPERAALHRSLYRIFVGHVADEIGRLASSDRYSVTAATKEAPFLLGPFMGASAELADSAAFSAELENLPMILVEDEQGRRNVSLSEVLTNKSVWSVQSPHIRSIEHLVKESSANITARSVINISKPGKQVFPKGLVICNLDVPLIMNEIGRRYEVARFDSADEDRQANMEWVRRSAEPRWITNGYLSQAFDRTMLRTASQLHEFIGERLPRSRLDSVAIPKQKIVVNGFADYGAVESFGTLWIFPGSPVAEFLKELSERADSESRLRGYVYLLLVGQIYGDYGAEKPDVSGRLERLFKQIDLHGLRIEFLDKAAFIDSMSETNVTRFNPYSWSRSEDYL